MEALRNFLARPELRRKLSGPIWTTNGGEEVDTCCSHCTATLCDLLQLCFALFCFVLLVAPGAAIALLLHGRLEDWLRNPQYVLEAWACANLQFWRSGWVHVCMCVCVCQDVVGSAVQMRYGTFQVADDTQLQHVKNQS